MNQSEFEEIHNWHQARENAARVILVVSDWLNKQNLCSDVTIILRVRKQVHSLVYRKPTSTNKEIELFYLFSSFLNSFLGEDGDAAIGSIDVGIYKLAKVCFHLFLFTSTQRRLI